jgi:tetratricopeptide (TPR) repeat protein
MVAGSFLLALACNGKKSGGTTPEGGGGGGDDSGGVFAKKTEKKLSTKAKKAFKKVEQDVKAVLNDAKNRGGKWTRSDCEKVADAFEKVARQVSGEKIAVARARFNQGVAYSKCMLDSKAKEAYQAALSAVSSYAPAKVNLAEMAARRGNHSAAYQTFLQAFLAQPQNIDANYNLAVIFERKARRGEPAPEVLKRFWRRLKFESRTSFDIAEAHLRMVLARSSAGKDERSAVLNLKAYTLLSLLYFQQSKKRKHRSKLMLAKLVLKEALKTFKKPVVKGKYCKTPEAPTDFDLAAAQLRNLTGLLLLRDKRLVEAMHRFEAALKCDANNVESHMNRAAIALGFRGYQIAHISFKRVLKQQPKRVDAIVGLGVALRGLASTVPPMKRDEFYNKAAAQYRKALSINPNYTDAIYNLGHLYMDYVNDKDKAEKWYKEYLAKPRRYTSRTARKEAKEQIAEIAYQRVVEAKMQKMERDAKRRREEQRRRAAAMPPPMERPMTAPKGM